MQKYHFVKCNFKLNKLTGSQGATAVLSILEYRFQNQPDGFYKFIEPCPHRLYKEGDSLAEELGVGRKSISRAFKKIGVKYNSRTDFDNATDKFQGKLYASYYDRYANLTFFVRNHELADELLKKYCKVKNSDIQKAQVARQKSLVSVPKEPFKNGHYVPSYIEAKNTPKNLSKDKSHADNEIIKKMIELWSALVGQGKEQIELTNRRISFLKKAFTDKFDSCLEKWKKYCEDIASSRFLMGEIKSSFRATLDWALKFDIIQKILEGNYGIGDRNPSSVPSASESFIKNSKIELASEKEVIQKVTDEPGPIRAFRLKWLNKFGANNYRECLKDCEIEVVEDATLILRPSSRYNAKSIASYWTPTLLAGSPFAQVHIVQQEGGLIFDKWFGAEQSKGGILNEVNEVKVAEILAAAPIFQTLPGTPNFVEGAIEGSLEEVKGLANEKPGVVISVTRETQMLRRKLRESTPHNQLSSWLENIEVESVGQDGTVVVTLEDSLAVWWCRSRFSREILQSVTCLWNDVNRLVIRQKEGYTIPISVENLSKKAENVEEKLTLEQAIRSLLSVCSPIKPMGTLETEGTCEAFG